MSLMNISASTIVFALNIIAAIFIFLAFLLGLWRGSFKATYRLIVDLIGIIGGLLLVPVIFKNCLDYDLSMLNVNILGHDISTLRDTLEFFSAKLLGLVDSAGELNLGEVVIEETYTYLLLYGLFELVFKLVFIVVLIILNWTIIRFFFFIIYLIIRPKKKVMNKRGKKVRKKPSGLSRLAGGLIGAFTQILILFMFCVPLAGIFSIVNDITSIGITEMFLNNGSDENNEMYLSLGNDEILYLDSTINDITSGDSKAITEFASIYRNTFLGKIYSIKINGTEIDNKAFDDVTSIKVKDKKVSIRKEIETVTDACNVISEDIIKPISSGPMTNEKIDLMLEKIDTKNITKAFNKLSELELLQVVVPVGLEYANYNILSKEDSPIAFVNINDVIDKAKEMDTQKLIKDVGSIVVNVVDFTNALDIKVSDVLDKDANIKTLLFEKILTCDTTNIENVFTIVGNLEIIDILNDPLVEFLGTFNDKVKPYLLMKPLLTVGSDGYINVGSELNSTNKTNIQYTDGMDLNAISIELNDDGKWVIGGIETNIDGSGSQLALNFKDIVLKDEIVNIGKIIGTFKEFDLTKVSDIAGYITNLNNSEYTGITNASEIDISSFNKTNLDKLFNTIFDSKIISNNTDNVYCIVNNILPNSLRGTLDNVPIKGSDISSVVLAAKCVVSSGYVDKLLKKESLTTNDIAGLFETCAPKIVDELFNSDVLISNLTPVCNYALNLTKMDMFKIPTNYDWKQTGKDELKSVCQTASTVVKHIDEIKSDFWSLSDNTIDEIFNSLSSTCSKSTLLRSNMNNLINYVNDKNLISGFTLVALDNDNEWTQNEINNILNGVKILLPIVKDVKDNPSEIITQIFKINEADVDGLLNSKFIVKTIINTLYENVNKSSDGILSLISVNSLPMDSDKWYDKFDNNNHVIKDGELRIIIKSGLKLVKGIDNFQDKDALIDGAITNIGKLSNNFKSSNDDIGEMLSSVVLTDTLINLLKKLPETTGDKIIVSSEITDADWKDSDTKPGELRLMLKAIPAFLIDSNGESQYKKLTTSNSNDMFEMFIGIDDERVNTIFDSRVIVDTLKKYVIDFSEGPDAYIVLKNKSMTTLEWKQEMKQMIIGVREFLKKETIDPVTNIKTVTYDIEGLQSFNQDELMNRFLNYSDESIDKIVASNILVDTMADKIVDLASDPTSVIKVPEYLSDPSCLTQDWRSEIKKMIVSCKKLLGENNSLDTLTQGTDSLLTMVCNLVDDTKVKDDLSIVLDSGIIVSTISNQIKGLDDTLTLKSTIYFDDNDWKIEIDRLIRSTKLILSDDEGNVSINKITSSEAGSLINLVINLSDEELDKCLSSIIITDTISDKIIDLGTGEDAALTISVSVKNYTSVQWKNEIINLIGSTKLILCTKDSNGKYFVDMSNLTNASQINDMINKVTNLTNNIGGDDDELGTVLKSMIICDTLITQLKDNSIEKGGELVIIDTKPGFTWYDYYDNNEPKGGELRAMFTSIKYLFVDGDININNIDSNYIIKECDTSKVFVSSVLKDTASYNVLDILSGPDLIKYINLETDYNDNIMTTDLQKTIYISEDIENLVLTLRNLDSKCNIEYTEFSYSKFVDACSTKNQLADTLQQSKLLVHSMNKMISSVLSESTNPSLGQTDLSTCINTNITDAEWKTVDSNSYEPFEEEFDNELVTENGEMRKVFNMLSDLEGLTKTSSFELTSSNKTLLHNINNSKALHGIVPEVIDKALSNFSDWKYTAVESRVLTINEWDNEIDVLFDVANEATGLDLNNLNVNTVNTTKLGNILRSMSSSRYINVAKVSTYVENGIYSTFNTSVTCDIVYNYLPVNDLDSNYSLILYPLLNTENKYATTYYVDKIDAWDDEISNLMLAVDKLALINSSCISDLLCSTQSLRIDSANKIGAFLDQCKKTTMLSDVTDSIISKLIPQALITALSIDLTYDGSSDYYTNKLYSIVTYPGIDMILAML